ncbi:DNA cytosine methyltransferase [Flavobacteriaceae bacterium D16]|nr:DNA cytosine methyltransferase [Flavobacteriaceae bacterium D16]
MNLLSFFSGAMGLDIGLEQANFTTLLACEIDKDARRTIELNRGDIDIHDDINQITERELDNILENDEVQVIAGGPPCQAFSTAGKRKGFNDDRGNVFLKYLEVIEYVNPRYFILENVRGLLSTKFQLSIDEFLQYDIDERLYSKPGSALYYAIRRLEHAGYQINFNLYNSKYFGTPQSRERVIIIGTTDQHKVPYLIPTHKEDAAGFEPIQTLRDAFRDLDNNEDIHATFGARTIEYLRLLNPGQNWRNLPESIQEEAMGNSFHLGGGKTGFYRRLDWDKPSPTLVTSPTMPATLLGHPIEDRPLSIKEYARIQQFPDNWEFAGNSTSIYKQIGNAVPVGVGRAIGNIINLHSEGYHNEEYADFKFSRYKNTSYDDFILNLHKQFEQTTLF